MVGCKSTAHFSTLSSTINRRIIRPIAVVGRVQNVVKTAQTPRFRSPDGSISPDSTGWQLGSYVTDNPQVRGARWLGY
jgi:hypothetical protein